jgi:large subunit ribosomal protein L15
MVPGTLVKLKVEGTFDSLIKKLFTIKSSSSFCSRRGVASQKQRSCMFRRSFATAAAAVKTPGRRFDLVSYSPAVAAQRRSDTKKRKMKFKANAKIGILSESFRDQMGNYRLNATMAIASPGSRRVAKRVGRGQGSGKGKTSGKGHKGQKARAGYKLSRGHEGGQTPVQLRFPKRGFNRKTFQTPFEPLNLWKLKRWISLGRLNPNEVITIKHMRDSNLIGKGIKFGVKLLAGDSDGKLDFPLKIQVTTSSEKAKNIVEEAGGQVQFLYLNRLNLRSHLKPHKFQILPRLARPPKKWLTNHKDSLAPVYSEMPQVQEMIELINQEEAERAKKYEVWEQLRTEIRKR